LVAVPVDRGGRAYPRPVKFTLRGALLSRISQGVPFPDLLLILPLICRDSLPDRLADIHGTVSTGPPGIHSR